MQLIRQVKDNGPEAELVLQIRPNGKRKRNTYHLHLIYVYFLSFVFSVFHQHQCDDDSIEEPPFQYTTTDEEHADTVEKMPSNGNNRLSMEPVSSLLDISMNLLQEGLESESLIIQFEVFFSFIIKL